MVEDQGPPPSRTDNEPDKTLFLLLSWPPQRQSIMEYQGGNMEYCRGMWEPERETGETGAILVRNHSSLTPPASASLYQMQSQPRS